jgi:hypothetical protein
MYEMILKKALVSSLLVFCMHAQAGQNREFLADRCTDLAHTVTSLIEGQNNPICVDKLYAASIQMSSAAALILSETDSTDVAKQLIDNAISALHYAQFNGCHRYIQIAHSKLEAYKLRHLV